MEKHRENCTDTNCICRLTFDEAEKHLSDIANGDYFSMDKSHHVGGEFWMGASFLVGTGTPYQTHVGIHFKESWEDVIKEARIRVFDAQQKLDRQEREEEEGTPV